MGLDLPFLIHITIPSCDTHAYMAPLIRGRHGCHIAAPRTRFLRHHRQWRATGWDCCAFGHTTVPAPMDLHLRRLCRRRPAVMPLVLPVLPRIHADFLSLPCTRTVCSHCCLPAAPLPAYHLLNVLLQLHCVIYSCLLYYLPYTIYIHRSLYHLVRIALLWTYSYRAMTIIFHYWVRRLCIC